jgi:hypothetical protein
MSKPRTRALHVTIVANNEGTLRGLQDYFAEAGVEAQGTRAIAELSGLGPATTAVVLFPDDFDDEDVTRTLAMLRRSRPRVLIVLVTREPQKFPDGADGRARAPLVLPKPSFGWSILDAIRASSEGLP